MHARQTKRVVFAQEFLDWVLLALTTDPAAALLDTAVVKLWADLDFTPTPLTTKAEFAAKIATFTDFAAKPYVPTGPRTIAGLGRAYGKAVEWLMVTDPTVTGQRIAGYWIEDADRVVLSEKFAPADRVDMVNPGDSLILEALIPLPYRFDISGEVIEV